MRPRPTFDETAYHEEVAALRRDALADDPLVLAADGHGGDVIDQVIVEVAREAAGLRCDRIRAEERGLETTPQLCSRVIDAYAKLSTLVLVRHELQRGNPTDAQIERVRTLFLEEVGAIVADVLGEEIAATYMVRLRTRIATSAATAR